MSEFRYFLTGMESSQSKFPEEYETKEELVKLCNQMSSRFSYAIDERNKEREAMNELQKKLDYAEDLIYRFSRRNPY